MEERRFSRRSIELKQYIKIFESKRHAVVIILYICHKKSVLC
jgi:hypothetical protein